MNLIFTENDLKITAQRILELQPDPAPRLRLARDVLHLSSSDPAYGDAESSLQESKWVALLKDSQWEDGTWGRFHTQDTRVKQSFPTTESAIAIALDLGLESRPPVIIALSLMEGFVRGCNELDLGPASGGWFLGSGERYLS